MPIYYYDERPQKVPKNEGCSALSSTRSALSSVLSALPSMRSALPSVLSALPSMPSALPSMRSALPSVLSALRCVPSALSSTPPCAAQIAGRSAPGGQGGLFLGVKFRAGVYCGLWGKMLLLRGCISDLMTMTQAGTKRRSCGYNMNYQRLIGLLLKMIVCPTHSIQSFRLWRQTNDYNPN